jgi:hypothetical protein
MSEMSENPITNAPAAAPPHEAPYKTSRVFQFAAWVAIVAGIVFIVAVIFFTGFALGHGGFRASWHQHGHHKCHAMIHPGHPGTQGGGVSAAALLDGGPEQMPASVSAAVTQSP